MCDRKIVGGENFAAQSSSDLMKRDVSLQRCPSLQPSRDTSPPS